MGELDPFDWLAPLEAYAAAVIQCSRSGYRHPRIAAILNLRWKM